MQMNPTPVLFRAKQSIVLGVCLKTFRQLELRCNHKRNRTNLNEFKGEQTILK